MGDSFILAHPDDEIACLQLLYESIRQGRASQIAWISNGDSINGNSVEGELEKAIARIQSWGLPRERMTTLLTSEKANYDALIDENPEPFLQVYRELEKRLSTGTDRLMVNAFQGGNVMHDMVHWLAVTAGRRNDIQSAYEFPCYEFRTEEPNFLFGRFGSYDSGIPEGGFGVHLSDEDLERKDRMVDEIYLTAARFFNGLVRPSTPRHIWTLEHYRPVSANRDYHRPPTNPVLYEIHGRKKQTEKGFNTVVEFDHYARMIIHLDNALRVLPTR